MATYEREVREKLGETNYNNILRAAREYKIDSVKMTQFAQYLAEFHEGSQIYGDHMRRKEQGGKCDEKEMKQLLSEYYREGMCNIPGGAVVSILRLLFKDSLKIPDVFKPETPEIKPSPISQPAISQATKMPQSTSESSRDTQTPRRKLLTKRKIDRKSRRSHILRIDGATTTDTWEFFLSSSSVLTDVIVSPDGTRQFKFEFKGTPRSSGESGTIRADERNPGNRQASNSERVQHQNPLQTDTEHEPSSVGSGLPHATKEKTQHEMSEAILLQIKEAQQYLRDRRASASTPRVRPGAHSAATARGPFDMGALREEQVRQNSANNDVHSVSTRAPVQPRSSPSMGIQPLHAATSASEDHSNMASTGSRPGEGAASTGRTQRVREVSSQTLCSDGNIAELNIHRSRRRRSIFELCEDLCNFCSTHRDNTPEVYFIGDRDILQQDTLSGRRDTRDTICEQPTSENNYSQESTWLWKWIGGYFWLNWSELKWN